MPNETDNQPSNVYPESEKYEQNQTPHTETDVFRDNSQTEQLASAVEVEPSTSSLTSSQPTPSSGNSQPSSTNLWSGTANQSPSYQDGSSSSPSTGYSAPTTQDEPPIVPKTTSKLNKKWLSAGIVAAALVVVSAGGAAAYNVWYQNPDKVIGDALAQAFTAKSATSSTAMTVTSNGDKPSSYDVTIKTTNNQHDARMDVTVAGKTADATFDLDASLLSKDNKKLYIKVNQLKDLLQKSGLQAYIGSSTALTNLINKLDSNWVVIDAHDIDDATGSKSKSSQCVDDVIGKIRTDKNYSRELQDLYKKHPLIGVKNKLGSKNGSLSYEVEFKRDSAIQFVDGVNKTTFFADLKKCDDKIKDLNGKELFKQDSKSTADKTKVVVSVDRWSHHLTKVELTGASDSSDIRSVTTTKFNVPVTIEAPKKAVTIDELKKDLEAIQQEMMQSYEAAGTSYTVN